MSASAVARLADAIGRPDGPRVDLACLAIGEALGQREGRTPWALGELDRLAAAVPSAGAPHERLREVLAPWRGAPDSYQRLESSLLARVLADRTGLPILLSTVWVEVARRAGIDAHGIALPGHYVVGVGDPDRRVLVDPWRGGELLPYDRARDIVEAGGHVFRREHIAPANPLLTVARVLANIRAWAAPQVRAGVRLAAIDLATALPLADPSLAPDRARALHDLMRFAEAAREFDVIADAIERDRPAEAEQARQAALRARARLN